MFQVSRVSIHIHNAINYTCKYTNFRLGLGFGTLYEYLIIQRMRNHGGIDIDWNEGHQCSKSAIAILLSLRIGKRSALKQCAC